MLIISLQRRGWCCSKRNTESVQLTTFLNRIANINLLLSCKLPFLTANADTNQWTSDRSWPAVSNETRVVFQSRKKHSHCLLFVYASLRFTLGNMCMWRSPSNASTVYISVRAVGKIVKPPRSSCPVCPNRCNRVRKILFIDHTTKSFSSLLYQVNSFRPIVDLNCCWAGVSNVLRHICPL